MEFAYGNDPHGMVVPIRIDSLAKEIVEEQLSLGGFQLVSDIPGDNGRTVPLNVSTCMEFINSHIRADEKNQLLLRTPMRSHDIQAIRDLATNTDTVSSAILMDKLARETIYAPMYKIIIEHRAAGKSLGQ
ncbi:hypothetical protein GGX14DRAFT_442698 [Mycena pura]|uniref:DUF8205 domain-containing protein n=1 Tax=Mycena pura TaxID=153505 RepID=A0AAD6VPM7_9AGAR|nr:hypothetical protein GGX14DRAFT_442698 [Mycena pura]